MDAELAYQAESDEYHTLTLHSRDVNFCHKKIKLNVTDFCQTGPHY